MIPHAARIIAHMNADHAEACLLYARHLAGVDGALHATLAAVDRRGMTLHVDTADAKRSARVAFARPVDSARQVRAAAVALLERARTLAAEARP